MKSKISETLALALKVNAETEHTVLFELCAHVALYQVRIYLGGWKEDATSDYWMECYFDKNEYLNNHGGYNANDIIARLNSLLEETKEPLCA